MSNNPMLLLSLLNSKNGRNKFFARVEQEQKKSFLERTKIFVVEFPEMELGLYILYGIVEPSNCSLGSSYKLQLAILFVCLLCSVTMQIYGHPPPRFYLFVVLVYAKKNWQHRYRGLAVEFKNTFCFRQR